MSERPEPPSHFKSALDRLATIASEAFGPLPVQSAEENLTAIESGIYGLRMDNDKLERERDEARADADEWQNKYAEVFVERDEARAQYRTTHLLAEALAKAQVDLKAERDEARGAVQGYRDAACRASCRDKEAADRAGGDVWSNI